MLDLNNSEVRAAASEIAEMYPQEMVAGQKADIDRAMFHVELVLRHALPVGKIADIGAGIGLFPPLCRKLGLKVTIVDDFQDAINLTRDDIVLSSVHRPLDVEIIKTDAAKSGVPLPENTLDAVTCFESIEHWHCSPKKVLHQMMRALKPGGVFALSAPNCVNLRKRITVPFGYGSWSRMVDWYEQPIFRGHVREPSLSDFRYIARDLGLGNTELIGRNWAGYSNRSKLIRIGTPMVDRLLQLVPSLCSSIYLVGRKS